VGAAFGVVEGGVDAFEVPVEDPGKVFGGEVAVGERERVGHQQPIRGVVGLLFLFRAGRPVESGKVEHLGGVRDQVARPASAERSTATPSVMAKTATGWRPTRTVGRRRRFLRPPPRDPVSGPSKQGVGRPGLRTRDHLGTLRPARKERCPCVADIHRALAEHEKAQACPEAVERAHGDFVARADGQVPESRPKAEAVSTRRANRTDHPGSARPGGAGRVITEVTIGRRGEHGRTRHGPRE